MKFVLGLDLHGTLLRADECYPKECLEKTCALLDKLKNSVIAMTCTGNDLTFVKEVLPQELLERLSGFVLETGCTFTDSLDGPEKLAIPAEVAKRRDELEDRFRSLALPKVTRFGRRLATISLFTKEPRPFRDVVADYVKEWGYEDVFMVTYSSVAVDIVPHGFDKLFGLRKAANGLPLIAVADSVNDLPLLAGADHSFAPVNIAPEAKEELLKSGREVLALQEAKSLSDKAVYIASTPEADGVIEILQHIDEMLSAALLQ